MVQKNVLTKRQRDRYRSPTLNGKHKYNDFSYSSFFMTNTIPLKCILYVKKCIYHTILLFQHDTLHILGTVCLIVPLK